MSRFKNNYANRGMLFEKIIENTNDYYIRRDLCHVRKIPTPIKILKVDTRGRIDGVFESRSSLDFNGILKGGIHIDFDAKETKSKTSFPFGNVLTHQFKYMKSIDDFGGITFLLVSFRLHNKAFILRLEDIEKYLDEFPNKKSIPYKYFVEKLKDNEVMLTMKSGVVVYDYLETLAKLYNNVVL